MEFRIAFSLLQSNLPFFLPLRLHSETVVKPLWTNYLFCRVDKGDAARLRRQHGVVKVLLPPDEEELLVHLKQFAPSSRVIPRVVPFEIDDRVRLRGGALDGFEATIHEVDDGNRRVKISLFMLGRTIQVSRDYQDVRLVHERSPGIVLAPIEAPVVPEESEQPEQPVDDSALRQLNLHLYAISKEYIAYLARHPDALYEIDPRRFEMLIAELFADMGYEVELTPQSRDGGRDILAALNVPHGKILTIIECKRFKPERKVGIDLVRSFLWVLDQKDRASCGLIATTSYFSRDAMAIENEYQWRLKLKDFDGLQDWLNKYGTWTQTSDRGVWVPDPVDNSTTDSSMSIEI